MNTQQPEALRLADALDVHARHRDDYAAADELRRLHVLNGQLTDKANREVIRNARLEEANQELLACLSCIVEECDVEFIEADWARFRAAIAKATPPSRQPLTDELLQNHWHKVWPEQGSFVRASADDLRRFANQVKEHS